MTVLQMTKPLIPQVKDFNAAANFNGLDQATRDELLKAFQAYATAINDRASIADANAMKAAVLKHMSAFSGGAANLTEISHSYVNVQGKNVTNKIRLVKRQNTDTRTYTRPELARCLIDSYNAAASGARTVWAIKVT